MDRMIATLGALGVVFTACGESAGEPVDPLGEDEYYALYLAEVLELGEGWWGYPPPADYCVAIAPGFDEPRLDQSRDPSQAVLARLSAVHDRKTFHPYSKCSSDYPLTSPAGDTAGLVWVKPLGIDRSELSGGWLGPKDLTEWGCTFVEADGSVKLEECELWTET